MGVRDAILRIVKELNDTDEEIFVYGPLIHNPQTVDILGRRGLNTIHELENIDNKLIAIRTHGVPIERLREIRRRSRRHLNLTCPRVSRVQGLIKNYSRQNYYTIIVGDEDHAEVISLKSYAVSGVSVISDPRQIKAIPRAERYIVVSQTTQDRERFDLIVRRLREVLENLTVFNTICDSTHNRQSDIAQGIERGIDGLVVVGGKASANTQRLARMGSERGVRTFHIETEAELDAADFRGMGRVLVTAGASTPGWIINNVMERLYEIKYANSPFFTNLLIKAMGFILRANILSAFAAAFFSLFAQGYAGAKPDYPLAAISMLYIFSMYTLNNYFDLDFLTVRNPVKYAMIKRHKNLLAPLAVASLVASLYLMVSYNAYAIALYIMSVVLGSFYSSRAFKSAIASLPFQAPKRFYNLKNIVSTFGWVISTTVIPLVALSAEWGIFLAPVAYSLALVFLRNIALDIIAFQGDLIFGRETLPTLIGVKKTEVFVLLIVLASALLFAWQAIQRAGYLHLLYLAVMLYMVLVFLKISSKNYFISLKYELILDANFILFIALYLVIPRGAAGP